MIFYSFTVIRALHRGIYKGVTRHCSVLVVLGIEFGLLSLWHESLLLLLFFFFFLFLFCKTMMLLSQFLSLFLSLLPFPSFLFSSLSLIWEIGT